MGREAGVLGFRMSLATDSRREFDDWRTTFIVGVGLEKGGGGGGVVPIHLPMFSFSKIVEEFHLKSLVPPSLF